jgi:hypothetical protein
MTPFAWLRALPEAPSEKNLEALLDRLRFVRDLGLDQGRRDRIHTDRWAQLVREGNVTPSWLANGFNDGRRLATIAAQIIELNGGLINAATTMFCRLVARLFTRSRARRDQGLAAARFRGRRHLSAAEAAHWRTHRRQFDPRGLGRVVAHRSVDRRPRRRSLDSAEKACRPAEKQSAVAGAARDRPGRANAVHEWHSDPALRIRCRAGLNKGEADNKLTRAVFFHERGEIRDGSFESQAYRASALNLVVSVIILWNTVYLSRVVDHLRADGHDLPAELLRHVSPQIWEHINLIGTYDWSGKERPPAGGFRPLRVHRLAFLAA